MFINHFHLTVQTDTVSLSFPLTFRQLSEISASSDKTRFQQNASPPFNYRLPFKYSMALIATIPIGTPPQEQQMVLDTGSQLSWIHCDNKSATTASFNPDKSSSFSDMLCNRPADCGISDSTLGTTCGYQAHQHLCHYSYFYADGSSAEGSLVRENFTFFIPRNTPRLIIGCTNKNDSSGAQGILGMNLGQLSFISQTGVPKFSYCVPLKINNSNTNPKGAFYLGNNPNNHTFQYINLSILTKSQHMPNFDPLAYTVPLLAISINGEKLNISKEAFLADAGGSGQTIIDSGSQYTYLVDAAYSKVREKIANLTGRRLKKINVNGDRFPFDMCFSGNPNEIGKMIGDMVFEFENGVEILIPKDRNLDYMSGHGVCFAVGRSELLFITGNIIGNFHQQNLWMEFDVKNRQVGFGNANCS